MYFTDRRTHTECCRVLYNCSSLERYIKQRQHSILDYLAKKHFLGRDEWAGGTFYLNLVLYFRKNFSIGTVWKKYEKSMCWSSMEWSSMIPRRRSITFPDFLKKDFFSLIFSSKPLRTTQGHHLRPSFAKMWLSS